MMSVVILFLQRSALAYRSGTGVRTEELRRDVFLGPRSIGISTASTTSRSTTKTSSSPYRTTDGYHTYGTHPAGKYLEGH